MVPKSGAQLPEPRIFISEGQVAEEIGRALRDELGSSRRATKTVMRWTGVSDHTARSWLQSRSSPSGLHLIQLSANSRNVFIAILKLSGHGDLELGLRLTDIEHELSRLITLVHSAAKGQ